MGEEELVAGDGWCSDDSSFYGDEDDRDRLLSLCEDFNPRTYCSTHQKSLNVIVSKMRGPTVPQADLFNPGQGSFDCWQLEETVEDFIKRLPPLTTSPATCDWIWVHYHENSKADISKIGDFTTRGTKLLAQSLYTRNMIENEGRQKPRATITKNLHQESKLLQQRITDLAVNTNVLSGKWMLFPELEELNRFWRLVVEGVVNNRLGPTAKVAPDDGTDKARLICVYTKDFRDKADVLRVLQELASMGLAKKPIYYKSDPYTILNIYRETAASYGLQASLYSSQKMLAEANLAKSVKD